MTKWWKNKETKEIVSKKISSTVKNKMIAYHKSKRLDSFYSVFKNRYLKDKDTECFIFKKKNIYGYGYLNYKGKTWRAHRLAYEIAHGKIDDKELCVSHKCDNRSCINPDHLCLMTIHDIMIKMMMNNRGRISQLSEEQKYEIKRLYIEDGIPRAELRKRFNTSMGVINFIIDNLYQDFKIKID